ncbi:hypothetical protein DXG03_003038 [Asterophora parasitica]|uniref:Uncharacterized protein n=1 Tax=Asterophora parasitica TaxID=117018 RepID=A0A9P7G1Q5_9AGAR|nr:hypothetical protein DXG03_003038 [Asterophora parasitica]
MGLLSYSNEGSNSQEAVLHETAPDTMITVADPRRWGVTHWAFVQQWIATLDGEAQPSIFKSSGSGPILPIATNDSGGMPCPAYEPDTESGSDTASITETLIDDPFPTAVMAKDQSTEELAPIDTLQMTPTPGSSVIAS